MKQQWERLEAWLQIHNPALLADLNPPASDTDIRELEQKLGMKLPADFVECLKMHDGQKGRSEWLFEGKEFLSIQSILMSWSAWNDLLDNGDFDSKTSRPAAGIQPSWWVKEWIPFATNGIGDYLCLDLAPSGNGKFGQVIKVGHDFPDRILEAVSFSDWFNRFVSSKQA